MPKFSRIKWTRRFDKFHIQGLMDAWVIIYSKKKKKKVHREPRQGAYTDARPHFKIHSCLRCILFTFDFIVASTQTENEEN